MGLNLIMSDAYDQSILYAIKYLGNDIRVLTILTVQTSQLILMLSQLFVVNACLDVFIVDYF